MPTKAIPKSLSLRLFLVDLLSLFFHQNDLPALRRELQKDLRAFIKRVGPELGPIYTDPDLNWGDLFRMQKVGFQQSISQLAFSFFKGMHHRSEPATRSMLISCVCVVSGLVVGRKEGKEGGRERRTTPFRDAHPRRIVFYSAPTNYYYNNSPFFSERVGRLAYY